MSDQKGAEEYYTLSEVSKRTGISMPTLQKYKKNHQDRIPSVGEGRKQRYPKAAFAVFEELKQEALGRRGRRKSVSSKKSTGSKSTAGASKKKTRRRKNDGMLSLMQVKERTGISYPTLLRYTRLHLDKIPHDDSGSRRRFPEAAVDVFRQLRQQSTRGRKPARPDKLAMSGQRRKSPPPAGSGVESRLDRLEASQRALQAELKALVEILGKPMTITVQRGR